MNTPYIDINLKKIANFLRKKSGLNILFPRRDISQNILSIELPSREVTDSIKELLGSSFTKLIYDGGTIPANFFVLESGIIEAYFPNALKTGTLLFSNSPSITTIVFDKLEQLNYQFAFQNSSLKNLIIKSNTLCTISSTLVANNLFALKELKVYVPSELLDTYKAATNWTVYKDRIFPISDYYQEEEENK